MTLWLSSVAGGSRSSWRSRENALQTSFLHHLQSYQRKEMKRELESRADDGKWRNKDNEFLLLSILIFFLFFLGTVAFISFFLPSPILQSTYIRSVCDFSVIAVCILSHFKVYALLFTQYLSLLKRLYITLLKRFHHRSQFEAVMLFATLIQHFIYFKNKFEFETITLAAFLDTVHS